MTNSHLSVRAACGYPPSMSGNGSSTSKGSGNGRKLSGGALASSLLRKVLNPAEVGRAIRMQVQRKAHKHACDDAQLALYSQILPSDFLHFCYFDDPARDPRDI